MQFIVLSFFLLFLIFRVSAFRESHKSLSAYLGDDNVDWVFNKLITEVICRLSKTNGDAAHHARNQNLMFFSERNTRK